MNNPYQSPGHGAYGPGPGQFVCPKCRGTMRTYDRSGIQLEQCDNCRGVFLDFGELESIIAMDARYAAMPPTPPPTAGHYGPGWGQHGGYHYRKHGMAGLFFST